MEQMDLLKVVQRLRDMNSKSTSEAKEIKYSCEKCKDTRLIQTDFNSYRQCECIARDKVNKSWRESGLSVEQLEKKTYKTFSPWNQEIKNMKDKATGYAVTFGKIQKTEQNSLYISGIAGCGKSHLAIATAGYLMAKKFNVMYMTYMEIAVTLKQNATNKDVYEKLLSKYKNAEILLIDDLLKNKPTDADLNILFQIIDYRYRAHLPMIISSERTIKDLLNWDNAIGRRIYEMSKGHIIENMDIRNNYSLKK
jgi:DNA replication protein DnaC